MLFLSFKGFPIFVCFVVFMCFLGGFLVVFSFVYRFNGVFDRFFMMAIFLRVQACLYVFSWWFSSGV